MTKVKVTGAYVNGHGPGSTIEVDDKSAKYLERIGYGEIQKTKEEPKVEEKAEKKAEAPKKKRKATKKKTDTDKD